MESTARLILPEILEALNTQPERLVELTEELHPADMADVLRDLNEEQAEKFLTLIPVDLAARLFEELATEDRLSLFTPLTEHETKKAASILDAMAPDDRADLVSSLDVKLQTSLIALMSAEESKDIRKLLKFEEGTAGALMTTNFVTLRAHRTAQESVDKIRHLALEIETIYQAYAVDPHGTLLGAVSLRDLVTSPSTRSIDEIMEPNIVTVPVHADQEAVAKIIAKYDLLAIPVVDSAHRILGMITIDDVLDVVEEEATEDVQKLGAVEPLESPYIQTPLWELFKARAPWLIVLFVAVLATRNVLEHYSKADPYITMLLWFVPLIASSGGNSGSQSATLVIRALALGNVELSQTSQVLARELFVGLLLGLVLGCLLYTSPSPRDATLSRMPSSA